MTGEFAGKSVIITGASSGLGAALALELARRGADLALFRSRRSARRRWPASAAKRAVGRAR
jgi:NAD(P)-dependent dehydrogenase (short-subunit alcohol dehydrogenase family)